MAGWIFGENSRSVGGNGDTHGPPYGKISMVKAASAAMGSTTTPARPAEERNREEHARFPYYDYLNRDDHQKKSCVVLCDFAREVSWTRRFVGRQGRPGEATTTTTHHPPVDREKFNSCRLMPIDTL